jgi:surfactin synthase thioesterase subunit
VSANELQATTAWINGLAAGSAGTDAIRLFSFPHAGGGASIFRHWANELSPEVDVFPVQLPGREGRWHEPAVTRLSELVPQLGEALGPLLRPPFALFGHSLGAFVAFELARFLRRNRLPEPAALFVSAARAPHIPDPDPPVHHLSPDELIEHLKCFDGIPRELLEHPEFVSLLIPTLRADMEMCETYTYQHEPPLVYPIFAYGGEHDRKAPREHLIGWRYQTSAEFKYRLFSGDHFYFLKQSRSSFLQFLREDLRGQTKRNASNGLSTSAEIEAAVAKVWGDVLRLPAVGLDKNFFDLGGNSLLMIQSYGKLRQITNMTLSVLDLFLYPTVRLLATAIGATRNRNAGNELAADAFLQGIQQAKR